MKTSRFKIDAVDVCAPFRLRITFGDGVVMNVDLAGVINRFPALSLLKDESVFSRAHVGEWGLTVDWISGEIDLAGDNLRAEAIEQSGGISHERIWNWMDRNNLTLDGAAEALGISWPITAMAKRLFQNTSGWRVWGGSDVRVKAPKHGKRLRNRFRYFL